MRVPSNHQTAVSRCGSALLLLAALLFTHPAFAAACIRFANASLQGQPATDKVQIKLDGVTLVDALGYKDATGYFDVDSGAPFLAVWFQGNEIVDRQLDIRDDRNYLFVVVGNGTSDRFGPGSTSSIGGTFYYPSSRFPPHVEANKFIDPTTFFVPGVLVPVGPCRIEVLPPVPNEMDPSFAPYTPSNGSYITQIL